MIGRFLRPIQNGLIQSYAPGHAVWPGDLPDDDLAVGLLAMSGSLVTSNLLALIFLPLAAGVVLLLGRWSSAAARQIALVVTTVTLLLAIVMVFQFNELPIPAADPHAADSHLASSYATIG